MNHARRILNVCLATMLGFIVGVLLFSLVADHSVGGGAGPAKLLPFIVPVLFGALGWRLDIAEGMAIAWRPIIRVATVYIAVIAGLMVSTMGLAYILEAYPEWNSVATALAVFPLPIVLGVFTWKVSGKMMASTVK